MTWFVLAGCAERTPPPPGGCDPIDPLSSGVVEWDDQGVPRTYRAHVPADLDPTEPAPLVLWFHGWGGDEDELLGVPAVTALADERGYVVVAPRGLGSGPPDRQFASWSFSGSTTGLDPDGGPICDPELTPDYRYPSCEGVAENGCSWTHCQADDVAFVTAWVEQLEQRLCLDPDRVFAAGGSNGGMFTWELAQRTGGLLRGVAPLIGLPHRGYLDANPEVAALSITGTRDPVVPPGAWDDPSFTTSSNGQDRFYYTGATAITGAWAAAAGCDGASVPFDDGVPETDCRTTCAGPGWPAVVDCRADMGHTYAFAWAWPLVLDAFDAWSAQ
ncbi:MAG: hypothetical protein ABMA64_40635 [Myxococcota bacterium]